MLILKGMLLAILLFVLGFAIFAYAVTPRNAHWWQGQFSVDIVHAVGMLTTGCGVGMLAIGCALLWLSRFALEYLKGPAGLK